MLRYPPGPGVRPHRWYISGARIAARGMPGTARRLVGSGPRMRVQVRLDGEAAPRLFRLADLCRLAERGAWR